MFQLFSFHFHLSRENFSFIPTAGEVGISPRHLQDTMNMVQSNRCETSQNQIIVTRISQTASPALSYWAFDPLPVDLKGHIQFSESEVLAFPAGMCLLPPMMLEGCFIYCVAACCACVAPLCLCACVDHSLVVNQAGAHYWPNAAYESDTRES